MEIFLKNDFFIYTYKFMLFHNIKKILDMFNMVIQTTTINQYVKAKYTMIIFLKYE